MSQFFCNRCGEKLKNLYHQCDFDKEGFNVWGFNRKEIHKNGTKYDDEGYGFDGFNKEGYRRNGLDKNGFYKSGFNKYGIHKDTLTRYDMNGFDRDGYNILGFNAKKIHKNGTKYNHEGYDFDGYDMNGFDANRIHKNGTKYNDEGYDLNGFDGKGFNKSGYNTDGFNKSGYNIRGFDVDGYNKDGFDVDGYNQRGFNKQYVHRNGTKYDDEGYDYHGYNVNGFDANAIHKNGTEYNDDGYNYFGFNIDGFDKSGYNIRGFDSNRTHKNGTKYNDNGYDYDGYDSNDFDTNRIHKNGTKYDDEGYDYDRYNCYGYDKQGFDKNGYDIDGFDKSGYNVRGFDNDKIHKNGTKYDDERYDFDGYDMNGFDEDGMNSSQISLEDHLISLLSEKRYEKAQILYYSRDYYREILSEEEFREIIRNRIKDYIEEYPDFYTNKPSGEQIDIIADMSQYLLVQARAGCGKTTTLTYKTHFLIKELGIQSDEIIFLAFNTKAAAEINKKFVDANMQDFQNAMTFHSFAGRLLSRSGKRNKEFEEDRDYKKDQALPDCIANILKNPEQKEKMYKLFKNEIDAFDRKIIGASAEKYLTLRDGVDAKGIQTYIALDGKELKSIGEKWVADFLFEHNLSYYYESILIWPKDDKLGYSPDFCLYEFDLQESNDEKETDNEANPFKPEILVKKSQPLSKKTWIEFFGIDELDPTQTTPPGWTKSFAEYVAEMRWKRKIFQEGYYAKEGHQLIEMNERDRRDGREVFEEKLKNKISDLGIHCEKLPHEILLKKVYEKNKGNLERRVESFIRKCMHRRWTPDDITDEYNKHGFGEPLSIFYIFAIDCYREYIKIMKEKGKQDFEMILMDATDYIDEMHGDIIFRVHKNPGKEAVRGHLQKLRYIIIDEYQDTSRLFHELVQSIRKYNPAVKIICVGDDWQLINTFAGSEMRFFENFQEHYQGCQKLGLRTTYRCSPAIVDTANRCMKKPGELISGVKGEEGFVNRLSILPFKNEWDIEDWNEEEKGKYCTPFIRDIIKEILTPYYQDIENNISPQFRILSRGNFIKDLTEIKTQDGKGTDLQRIMYDLKDREIDYSIYKKNIEEWLVIQTVHKAKGLESDYVLLPDVGVSFPKIHPDNIYGIIFGETIQDILDEERRLFYVAITRAKKGIFFTSKNNTDIVDAFDF